MSHGKQASPGSLDSGAAHIIRNHRLVVQQQHGHVEDHLETAHHVVQQQRAYAEGHLVTPHAGVDLATLVQLNRSNYNPYIKVVVVENPNRSRVVSWTMQ